MVSIDSIVGFSYRHSILINGLYLTVFVHILMTDGQTDRQTDGIRSAIEQ